MEAGSLFLLAKIITYAGRGQLHQIVTDMQGAEHQLIVAAANPNDAQALAGMRAAQERLADLQQQSKRLRAPQP